VAAFSISLMALQRVVAFFAAFFGATVLPIPELCNIPSFLKKNPFFIVIRLFMAATVGGSLEEAPITPPPPHFSFVVVNRRTKADNSPR